MDECGVRIIPNRHKQWLSIYSRWKTMLDIHFFNDIDSIVDDIINGNNRTIAERMTMGKEIVLSKKLLFEHNLSLKTFGIDVMPLNTNQWHALLEENVYHDLSKYKA
jgi:hypothetical protein